VDPDKVGVGREDIRNMLLQHEIESRPLWKPMHMQPLFGGAQYVGSGFDERLFETGLCLSSGSDMTEAQQGEVIDRIQNLIIRS
jgi:pyridoxal phosphate-dependent aminotransferase EpsN